MTRFIPCVVLGLLLSGSVAVRSQSSGGRESLRLLARACPFPLTAPETLRQQAASAKFILYGTLANPTLNNPAGDEKTAVTDMHILTVVKSDPALKDAKIIQLARYIPVPDPKKPPQYLLFCDIHKGRIDAYKGIPLTSDALPKYLKEALKLDPKKPGDAILFFQRHLDSPTMDIVQDAHRELSAMVYADIRLHAPRLPADRIAARLKNADTPLWLLNLDAMLLGHCGNKEHADFLKSVIADRCKPDGVAGLEGALIGYTLLRPKEGLARMRELASHRALGFRIRYQTLKALRFFGNKRPDVLKRPQVIEAMEPMLAQRDIADLVIEDFRGFREERVLDRVLALSGQKELIEIPIIRRAIVRYALTFPKNAKAAQFIDKVRAEDSEFVEAIEEILKEQAGP